MTTADNAADISTKEQTDMNTQSQETNKERESDGRFALKMESKTSVKRWMKRDAEREARRQELEAEFGGMADCFA